MDLNTYKILKIINKYPNGANIDIIVNKINMPKDDFIEILTELKNQKYIKFTHNNIIEIINKGKTYFTYIILNWLSDNILSIIAIIISIIALIK